MKVFDHTYVPGISDYREHLRLFHKFKHLPAAARVVQNKVIQARAIEREQEPEGAAGKRSRKCTGAQGGA
eukprot:1530504-Rhodomonas_salina.1